MSTEILTVKQAAKMAQVSQNTLLDAIKGKHVRAFHLGRGIKLLRDCFEEDLKSLCAKDKVTDKITGKTTWVSTNGKTPLIGELGSRLQTDREYNDLLAPKTSKQRKGSMIN
jgi:predicted transcriptional regulator